MKLCFLHEFDEDCPKEEADEDDIVFKGVIEGSMLNLVLSLADWCLNFLFLVIFICVLYLVSFFWTFLQIFKLK